VPHLLILICVTIILSQLPFLDLCAPLCYHMANMNIKGLKLGLCNSPDIFQEKMSNLMDDLEFCRAYIDDILVITKDSWEQHLVHLQTVFTRLQQAGLKVNATKSFFGKSELEYLEFGLPKPEFSPYQRNLMQS
jgi:Reverse transcriptase (RNA-dependent DNA polymerase)